MQQNNFKTDNILYSGISKISTKQIIPSLQRPYVWDRKNINKLWSDIFENPSPYFIGTIVFVAGEGSASRDEVIDGQQRLTTLSLFLIALLDYMTEADYKNSVELQEQIRILLFEPQFEGDPLSRIEFIDSKSNDVYLSLLNNTTRKMDTGYGTETEKIFHDNYHEIKKLIPITLEEFSLKPEDILQKLKGLELVVIQCASKTSGYKLFEGLNATAVSLTGVDLIKNALLMTLSEDPSLLREAEECWQELEEKFSSSRKMFQTFIRHQWLSSMGYVSHAGLFAEFEKSYLKKGDKKLALGYIKELLADADIYLSLRHADVDGLDKLTKIRFDRDEIKNILEFLDYLNVDQVYPILLYIYRNNVNNFKKYLIKLTSFQFLFKFLPGSPSIVEKYFAQFCRNEIDAQKLFNALEKLTEKQEDNFIESFSEKTRYKKGKSGDVQFILQKFLYSDSKIKSHEKPTIEHIVPQCPPTQHKKSLYDKFGSRGMFIKQIQEIGNLTILERKTNSDDFDNKSFEEKARLFKEDVFPENKNICDYDFAEEPQKSITERGEYLAKKIYKLFLKSLNSGKF